MTSKWRHIPSFNQDYSNMNKIQRIVYKEIRMYYVPLPLHCLSEKSSAQVILKSIFSTFENI